MKNIIECYWTGDQTLISTHVLCVEVSDSKKYNKVGSDFFGKYLELRAKDICQGNWRIDIIKEVEGGNETIQKFNVYFESEKDLLYYKMSL